MSRWLRAGAVAALAMTIVAIPDSARADTVDEAFVAGNRAAAEGRWQEAARRYETAAGLLGARNAVLEYNLGTAYAHTGDLGRGTYYLLRAMDVSSGPTPDVVERARLNLEEVRRRAELLAAAESAQIDRPASWWDLLLDGFRAPWVGWVPLLAGVLFVLGLGVEMRRRRARAQAHAGALQAALVVLALIYLVVGALHGVALRADAVAPRAVVLGRLVEARERPGRHADAAFTVVGGARVRVAEQAPGWTHARLPGGLSGWIPEEELGLLDSPKPKLPPPRSGATPKGSGANAPVSARPAP